MATLQGLCGVSRADRECRVTWRETKVYCEQAWNSGLGHRRWSLGARDGNTTRDFKLMSNVKCQISNFKFSNFQKFQNKIQLFDYLVNYFSHFIYSYHLTKIQFILLHFIAQFQYLLLSFFHNNQIFIVTHPQFLNVNLTNSVFQGDG